MWKFFELKTARGGVLADWYGNASVQIQAQFDARYEQLLNAKPTEWREPWVKPLKGYDEIIEIRFKADKVQQRLLGYYNGSMQFTVTVCATEKNDRFVPPNAPRTADDRRKDIAAGKAEIRVYVHEQ